MATSWSGSVTLNALVSPDALFMHFQGLNELCVHDVMLSDQKSGSLFQKSVLTEGGIPSY